MQVEQTIERGEELHSDRGDKGALAAESCIGTQLRRAFEKYELRV